MQAAMEFRAVGYKGRVYSGGFFTDNGKVGIINCKDKNMKINIVSTAACMGFYTGIKDSKGFKIYTNDLVIIKSNNEFNGLKGIVLFHKGECLVGTDAGYFNLNNSETEYVTKGNAVQYKQDLSDKLKDMLIELRGFDD